jgi:hypothetical protein
LQYFLAMTLPVEVCRFAVRTVQSDRQVDQRFKIKFRLLGVHAGKYLASVLLPRAVELREKVLGEFPV